MKGRLARDTVVLILSRQRPWPLTSEARRWGTAQKAGYWAVRWMGGGAGRLQLTRDNIRSVIGAEAQTFHWESRTRRCGHIIVRKSSLIISDNSFLIWCPLKCLLCSCLKSLLVLRVYQRINKQNIEKAIIKINKEKINTQIQKIRHRKGSSRSQKKEQTNKQKNV